jgi:sugar O-acyltransferase (sialic acid O-acetyltransferase NeuD family)
VKDLYVIGAGGHAAVVAEIAAILGWRVVGFVDDNLELAGTKVLDWNVLGGRENVPHGASVVAGIGHNVVRGRLIDEAERAGWELPVLVHPSAVISPSAVIGCGTVVVAQAVVNARSRIGRGCILNTSCSVDHDCDIGDAAHIAPGCRLAGSVTVGDRTLVGVGSCVRPGITIGADCLIGAGSTVVKDIPAKANAFGNPAVIRTASPNDG